MLVVEDEMMILMMIEDMLAELGCKSVASAATIDQALALIGERVFDGAMLDMNLDGQDSQAVADALDARDVPFIYSTGNREGRHTPGVADHGVLRKPFTFDEMTSSLTRLLPR